MTESLSISTVLCDNIYFALYSLVQAEGLITIKEQVRQEKGQRGEYCPYLNANYHLTRLARLEYQRLEKFVELASKGHM